MPLSLCSLNSGSNGNCYYVGNSQGAVLVDAGISCRETVKRLARAGLSISQVKAVFISHEHSDHIRGVEVLSRKFRIPVFVTPLTKRHGSLEIEDDLCQEFSADQAVEVAGMRILPFRKEHDACDPHSFIIEHENTCVGVFTDIGKGCRQVVKHFSRCHAAILESNYDEEMLRNGHYPYHLKKRISGGMGHLSNAEALKLFLTYRRPELSHLVLGHLSAENNCPILVEDLFRRHAGNTQVAVASRYEESPVFVVNGGEGFSSSVVAERQLSLFAAAHWS